MPEPITVEHAISEIEKIISEKNIEISDASIAMCILIGRNIGTHAMSIDDLSEGAVLHAKKTFVEAMRVYSNRILIATKHEAETPE